MHLKLAPQQIQRAILQRCTLALGEDHWELMAALTIQSLVGTEWQYICHLIVLAS